MAGPVLHEVLTMEDRGDQDLSMESPSEETSLSGPSPTMIVVRRVSVPVTGDPEVVVEGFLGLGRGLGGRNFPFSEEGRGLLEWINMFREEGVVVVVAEVES